MRAKELARNPLKSVKIRQRAGFVLVHCHSFCNKRSPKPEKEGPNTGNGPNTRKGGQKVNIAPNDRKEVNIASNTEKSQNPKRPKNQWYQTSGSCRVPPVSYLCVIHCRGWYTGTCHAGSRVHRHSSWPMCRTEVSHQASLPFVGNGPFVSRNVNPANPTFLTLIIPSSSWPNVCQIPFGDFAILCI